MLNNVYEIDNPDTEIDFHEISQNNAVLRRGPGSKQNFYSEGIHQDYGLNITSFTQSLTANVGKFLAD